MKEFRFIKQLVSFIEDHSPGRYSLLFAIPIIFLVLGLLIWSVYLYTFGFVEDELLRAKYIFSGVSFTVVSIIVLGIIDVVLSVFSKIKEICKKILIIASINPSSIRRFLPNSLGISKVPLYIFLSFVWFVVYVIFLFPSIPGFLGGGQPRSISIIASKETMPILNSLEVQLGAGATYQTENVCIIHQSSTGIYILRNDRALMIDNSLFKGQSILPGLRAIQEQYCIVAVKNAEMAGVVLELALIETQIVNIYNSITGKPLIYLGVTNTPPVTLNK